MTWASSASSVIGSDGSVSRAQLNTQVMLTASISKGSTNRTKLFTITVKGTTDVDELAIASAKLSLTEALVLVIIIVIGQFGKSIRKNRGIYF